MSLAMPIPARPRRLTAVLAVALAGLLASAAAAAPKIAVSKYVKGNVRISAGEEGGKDLQASEVIFSGARLEAGQDGKATLRLLPDNAFLEIRPKTVFKIRRTKSASGQAGMAGNAAGKTAGKGQGKRLRRINLETGEVIFGLRKQSDSVQCENINTVATAGKARFSCKIDENAAGILIVQDGEVSVYNRPKNLTAMVRSGQKAVSDINGIKISDATDTELEQVGFRQNTIEVDFINPQSEEFTTLEVEYETSF